VNILLATDVFPPGSGGSGWSTFYLARTLAERGHHVEIVQPKLGVQGTRARMFEGLNVVEVGYDSTEVPGLRAWQRPRVLEKTLTTYLAQRAPAFDLIHAQHVLTIPAAVNAKKAVQRDQSIPVITTVRDYWPVCLYGTLWRDRAICPICRNGEITRCLAQKYSGTAKFMQPLVPLVQRELQRRQRALRASDAVIAVSRFVRETLREALPLDRVTVVPNLIAIAETERLAAGFKRLESDKSRLPVQRYLLFVGKLNVLKGADLLPQIIRASGVPLPLIVVGDGELRLKLGQSPGIEVRGWVSNAETLSWIAGAAALLFPARWAEPLARTLLEAQALGVPTVALETGGTRDIIQDNFNGLLAPNLDEFAAQLRRLVQDPALRRSLGANAKRVAFERFSHDIVAAQIEMIYETATRYSQLATRNSQFAIRNS
jgi:glycogen synthase